MSTSPKEQIWLDTYLRTFNATEAARVAGYQWPEKQGYQKKQKFREEINELLRQRAMTPAEIIDELQQIALGDIADYFNGYTVIDLEKAKEDGKSKLVKKLKQRTVTKIGKTDTDEDVEVHDLELEMYSRHEALRDLGKIHSLFVERTENTGEIVLKIVREGTP